MYSAQWGLTYFDPIVSIIVYICADAGFTGKKALPYSRLDETQEV